MIIRMFRSPVGREKQVALTGLLDCTKDPSAIKVTDLVSDIP